MPASEHVGPALRRERKILVVAFSIAAIMFVFPGVMAGFYLATSVFGKQPPETGTLAKLCFFGFVAIVVIGTLINGLILTWQLSRDALRRPG